MEIRRGDDYAARQRFRTTTVSGSPRRLSISSLSLPALPPALTTNPQQGRCFDIPRPGVACKCRPSPVRRKCDNTTSQSKSGSRRASPSLAPQHGRRRCNSLMRSEASRGSGCARLVRPVTQPTPETTRTAQRRRPGAGRSPAASSAACRFGAVGRCCAAADE